MSVIVLLITGLLAASASADALIPLSTIRHQPGLNCWAYGASFVSEARFEAQAHAQVAIDIEKSAYYWQIQDRLMNSFIRKKPSSGILMPGGYAVNFWSILAQHGLETFAVSPEVPGPAASFSYPSPVSFLLDTKLSDNPMSPLLDSIPKLEAELIAAGPELDAETAAKKIREAVDSIYRLEIQLSTTTGWPGGAIPTAEVFSRLVGADASVDDFVLLSSHQIEKRPELEDHWLRYDDDRFWAIGKRDTREILALARLSLDRGWPVTLETVDHVMTGVGYHTLPNGDGHYAYAVIDGDGTYFAQGLSWVSEEDLLKVLTDATVNYPVLADALPKRVQAHGPARALAYPSIDIPRKN